MTEQAKQIGRAIEQQRALSTPGITRDATEWRKHVLAVDSACHHFAVVAHKVIEHRDSTKAHGLFLSVDFSELDEFSRRDIQDLRNTREHMVQYFQGKGLVPARWMRETPDFRADASSLTGSMIGGRLDWKEFSAAIERLIPALLAEPVAYPSPRFTSPAQPSSQKPHPHT